MILVLDVLMLRVFGVIQVVVLDVQERGRLEILFGYYQYNMIFEVLVVSEVVLIEQVEWEEQIRQKKGVSEVNRGVVRIEGERKIKEWIVLGRE